MVDSLLRYDPSSDLLTLNLTDAGNGERLREHVGDRFAYVHAWGSWMHFDGVRWQRDGSGEAVRGALHTLRSMAAEAAKVPDGDHRAELLDEGRADEAITEIEAALQRLSTSPGLLMVYAVAAKAADRLEVAHLVYQRVLRWLDGHGASPDERRDAMEGRAELDVRLKQYDEAADAYSWLAEQWPEKRWYRYRRGVTLGLAGRYEQAVEELSALHAEGPPSGVVCAKLGLAHRQLGDVQTAIQFFNEALMLDQFEPVALAQLAEIRAIQGRANKARTYLERLDQVEGAEDAARRVRRMLGQ